MQNGIFMSKAANTLWRSTANRSMKDAYDYFAGACRATHVSVSVVEDVTSIDAWGQKGLLFHLCK